MKNRQKLMIRAAWLMVAVIIIALDQWTKYLAVNQLYYGQVVEVLPVFNFTLQYNTGAAFSFLADAGGWQRWFFTAVSGIVSVVLIIWLCRLQRQQIIIAISLSLILGGAIGNFIDRILLGYVVDFISVHYHDAFFPAFNIADSAITLGAGFMILDMFIGSQPDADDKSGQ